MFSIDCKNFLIESLMIIAFMQPKENFLFSLFPVFWKEKKIGQQINVTLKCLDIRFDMDFFSFKVYRINWL